MSVDETDSPSQPGRLPRGMVVCTLGQVAEGGARSFVFGSGVSRVDVVVVRAPSMVRAYVNSCPHLGTPLETLTDRFLSEDGSFLVCSTHGAQFRLDDGVCTYGPCLGQALEPVAVRVVGDEVCVV